MPTEMMVVIGMGIAFLIFAAMLFWSDLRTRT